MSISLPQSANGVVLYHGRSMLDGEDIVAIATLESANTKTGNMVQTWILRSDIPPMDAIRSGGDKSICGDCPQRGDGTGTGRNCYVNVGQAPASIWRTWQANGYPRALPSQYKSIVSGRAVRLGAYGDPAMVPYHIWADFVKYSAGWTGYTHQWREEWAQPLRSLCMASVESDSGRWAASLMGWRTFRVRSESDPVITGVEIVCPASPEGGNKLKCMDCLLCCGTGRHPSARSVVIVDHGPLSPQSRARRSAAAKARAATRKAAAAQ